ncbi:MAG: NUDIX domain-containing protein [Patescibacteria group bacterium]|nr:NUDIX domain-containing protein [Patescibacteria group bacterium]
MADLINPKLYSIIVNGVVFKGDKVLVSQRSWEEEHEPGKWTIPGGKIDRTEGDVFNIIEKTLAREIMEETGVETERDVKLITNNTFIRSDGQHVIALVFKCEYKFGEAKALEDTIDCKWATLEEVKDMEFPPNVKEYILKGFSLKS